ncbi:MAG: hypothetical protein O3A53_17020 [Acidobacteria bacterium]|nr:hypothetical protein [Acidobacteriota bacterium]MDA1236488.1 hypothetical protein [Acidobacteriota bacterium]
MKKLIPLLFLLPLLASAEILPERLGDFDRTSLEAAPVADSALFAEFDYEAGELGVFQTKNGLEAKITAYRFYDDTGAYAAFLWGLAEGGVEDTYGERAWSTPGRMWIHFGNYVVEILGDMPEDDNIELMMGQYFPNVRLSADPPVTNYLPPENMNSGSKRYILGPTSLSQLAPEVPPSVAAFHFGTEAVLATYGTGEQQERLALFSYPTPQMAREQIELFRTLPNVVAMRDVTMIAAVLAPTDPDAAQVLLSKVHYRGEVTTNYQKPGRHDNMGTLLLDIVVSCLILAGLCIVGGVFVAGTRHVAAKVVPNSIIAPRVDVLTRLHLDEKDSA